MSLTWESTYALAIELQRVHPDVDLRSREPGRHLRVDAWQLPDFEDDPALCNDEILSSIYQEWYEVTVHD